MNCFYQLYLRFLQTQSEKLDWPRISPPSASHIIPYSSLKRPVEQESELLGKLAVLKLNGGLGTTMGCVGPKSAIEVREGMTFLDLTVRQLEVKSVFPS